MVNTPDLLEKCDCVKRTEVPPLPTKLPFDPTPENRGKFEHYIKEYYKTSGMNTCEQEEIPEISGEKMSFHFKVGATVKTRTHQHKSLIITRRRRKLCWSETWRSV